MTDSAFITCRERRDLEQVVHAADQQLLMFSRRQVDQIEDLVLPPILRGLEPLSAG
ncbi:MAG: hypothetical protein H0T44_14180 [Gemmatimonadales bacterium]|nr:hypothetical protein [Gemmatimonadales bacterium]